jgi:hypothetical protein
MWDSKNNLYISKYESECKKKDILIVVMEDWTKMFLLFTGKKYFWKWNSRS